jgi:small GTP-binding protein
MKQKFDNRNGPTVAPAFHSQPVQRKDGLTIVLQIWDTAGQERYSSISQLFFRDSDVALVCFDPGDESSFAGVKEWIPRILEEVPECRLYGVMTKADTHEQSQLQSILDSAKGSLSDINFEQFFITSAKTREGVDTVFMATAEAYARRGLDNTLIPKSDSSGSSCC